MIRRWNLKNDQVRFSNSWQAFTGYTRDNFIPGSSWFEIIAPAHAARASESTNACLSGQVEPCKEVFAIRLANGSSRWIRSLIKSRVGVKMARLGRGSDSIRTFTNKKRPNSSLLKKTRAGAKHWIK
ncbi:MAG: PAS domain-containing protein [Gammaproteobacteria bacterium]